MLFSKGRPFFNEIIRSFCGEQKEIRPPQRWLDCCCFQFLPHLPQRRVLSLSGFQQCPLPFPIVQFELKNLKVNNAFPLLHKLWLHSTLQWKDYFRIKAFFGRNVGVSLLSRKLTQNTIAFVLSFII